MTKGQHSLMRMSSWQDALQHLRAVHPALEADGADAVRVTVTCRDKPRAIGIRHFAVGDVPWIEVSASLGRARFLPPVSLLVRNLMLPIGSVGVDNGMVQLRQTLPIGGLRTEDLDTVIEAMADGLETMPGRATP